MRHTREHSGEEPASHWYRHAPAVIRNGVSVPLVRTLDHRGKHAHPPEQFYTYFLKRRNRSELLTTVTEERAMAVAANMGAQSFKKGMSGERIAIGMRTTLYPKAQKRFCLMTAIVARESAKAVTTLFKFPLT